MYKISEYKIKTIDIIDIGDFATKLNFNILKNLYKQNIYFIYDKKGFYEIDTFLVHERTQE